MTQAMAAQASETEPFLPVRNTKVTGSGEVSDHEQSNAVDLRTQSSKSELGLRRSLSLIDGISVLVGIIVGSGIFASPGVVLLKAGSVGLGITAWLVAAFIALCSALVSAELGAAIPQAGGNAEFFKVAFGDAWAFAFVWTMFFVLTNGSLAIVAITFSRYFVAGITGVDALERDMDSDPLVKAVAIACVAMLTFCNCFGVHVGSGLQNAISLVKLMLVTLLAVAAPVFLWGDTSVVESNLHQPFAGSTISGFGVASVAALWAFTGWGDLVFLTEEMKDPARDIPRGTIGSISLVAVVYVRPTNCRNLCPEIFCLIAPERTRLLASTGKPGTKRARNYLSPSLRTLLIMNVAYLCILPAPVIKSSSVVAIDAIKAALGPWAGSTTAILVSISVLGSANGIIICGARYLYAAAREGQIPRSLGVVGQQSRSPYVAHLVQGLLCILLLLQSSNFVELLSYFGVSSFLFYGLTGAAHMKIRHTYPDLHRPYTVAFYPYAPIIVMCFSLYLLVSTLVANPVPTVLSLTFVVVSFPIYFLFVRQPRAIVETPQV